MSYSNKICRRCHTEYSPTSGIQYVCANCKDITDKERRKSYRLIPEWRERRKLAIRKYYQKNWKTIGDKKRHYQRERAKNNPELRRQRYLRGKDRLKLLRYTAELVARCFKCDRGWPLQVHHVDENPNNHSIDNLKWVCVRCHYEIHGYFYNPVVETKIASADSS